MVQAMLLNPGPGQIRFSLLVDVDKTLGANGSWQKANFSVHIIGHMVVTLSKPLAENEARSERKVFMKFLLSSRCVWISSFWELMQVFRDCREAAKRQEK